MKNFDDIQSVEELQNRIPKKKKGVLKKVVLGFLILIAVAGLLWWGIGAFISTGQEYKAVFLNNEQVYFGKISPSFNFRFLNLKDVYYLQVNEQIQPVGEGARQPQLVLVKLGAREIHNPQDEMLINRDHILFIEKLKPDSQVIAAIKEHRKSQN